MALPMSRNPLITSKHHLNTSKYVFSYEQTPFDHEQTPFEQPSFNHEQTLRLNSRRHPLNSRMHPVTLSCGDCARTGVACGKIVTTEVLGLYVSSHRCILQTLSTTTNTQLRSATKRGCMHRLHCTRLRDVERMYETYLLLCNTCVRNMIS